MKCVCGNTIIERKTLCDYAGHAYERVECYCEKCGCRFVTRDQSEANSRAIKDRNIATYYN